MLAATAANAGLARETICAAVMDRYSDTCGVPLFRTCLRPSSPSTLVGLPFYRFDIPAAIALERQKLRMSPNAGDRADQRGRCMAMFTKEEFVFGGGVFRLHAPQIASEHSTSYSGRIRTDAEVSITGTRAVTSTLPRGAQDGTTNPC